MNDLALDPITGDLSIDGLTLYIIQGADAVRQQLDLKLTTWVGTWFLDTEFGTPYLESILGKQITLNGAIAALKKSILEVSDVNQITQFDYEYDNRNRKFTVAFECSTPYGLIRVAQKESEFNDTFDYDSEELLNEITNVIIPSHGY